MWPPNIGSQSMKALTPNMGMENAKANGNM
jgi:hypothetical protein